MSKYASGTLQSLFSFVINKNQFCSTVDKCSDIKTIESCVIAIVITSSLAVILTFAGSIIGCMGVCCAKPQVSDTLPPSRGEGIPPS